MFLHDFLNKINDVLHNATNYFHIDVKLVASRHGDFGMIQC